MSTVFIQDAGDIIEWTAAADVTSNDFIVVGTKLGVALADAVSGAKVSVKLTGVIRATKSLSEDLLAGAVVTATTTTNTVESTGGTLTDAGIVVEESLTAAGTVLVRLNA